MGMPMVVYSKSVSIVRPNGIKRGELHRWPNSANRTNMDLEYISPAHQPSASGLHSPRLA